MFYHQVFALLRGDISRRNSLTQFCVDHRTSSRGGDQEMDRASQQSPPGDDQKLGEREGWFTSSQTHSYGHLSYGKVEGEGDT